jgi:CO dehydrogenase maturation factor
VQTATRINNLVDELNLEVDDRKLIINRISEENFDRLKNSGIDLPFKDVYSVPDDNEIFHLDLEGRPVFELPSDSVAVKTVFKILDSFNIP